MSLQQQKQPRDGGMMEEGLRYAILDGHEIVVVDLMTWAKWFEDKDKTVERTSIGDVKVSTVFLGVDHSWGGGKSLWFETMIFGGPLDQEQWR